MYVLHTHVTRWNFLERKKSHVSTRFCNAARKLSSLISFNLINFFVSNAYEKERAPGEERDDANVKSRGGASTRMAESEKNTVRRVSSGSLGMKSNLSWTHLPPPSNDKRTAFRHAGTGFRVHRDARPSPLSAAGLLCRCIDETARARVVAC